MSSISKPLSSFLSRQLYPNFSGKRLPIGEEIQKKISLVQQQIIPGDELRLITFTHEVIQKDSPSHVWTLTDAIDALGLFARMDSSSRDYILPLASKLTIRTESAWDPQSRLKLFYLLSKPSTAELEDLINFTIWLCRGEEFSVQNQLAMLNILLSIPALQRKIFADQAGELFCGTNAYDLEKCILSCQEFAKLTRDQRNDACKEYRLSKGSV